MVIVATTNIGGGKQFRLTDSLDLQGAKLIVIVPHRDKKGIEHAEKVAEFFPEALWLYPYLNTPVWGNYLRTTAEILPILQELPFSGSVF